ncbi:MAG: caspase family protein, partial [Gammaproteobacteria bacterium]|nr:caspase family protein [Gammaproteobacteria bacterium]
MRLSARIRSLCSVSFSSIGVVTAVCLCWLVVSIPLANGGEIVRSDDIVRQMKPKPRTRGIVSEPTKASSNRVVLPAIQFEIDSARFTRTALAQVKELGKALKSDVLSPFIFAVLGHTDSTGSSAYNRSLSSRRARAVTRYLKYEMDVAGARLIQVGLGESFPIAGIPTTDARNRRVEITKLGGRAPAEDVRRNRRRALLIGIDKYRHVSPLNGPVKDAKDLEAFIKGHMGFKKSDVRLLLDREATKKNIMSTVKDWLVEGTNVGDEVFLFYSGHGFQQPDMDGDEADNLDETLVPVDASVDESGKIK